MKPFRHFVPAASPNVAQNLNMKTPRALLLHDEDSGCELIRGVLSEEEFQLDVAALRTRATPLVAVTT